VITASWAEVSRIMIFFLDMDSGMLMHEACQLLSH
jgi:hypothetical protein